MSPKRKSKKKWEQGAVKRPGALTRKADAAGESVRTFAAEHAHDAGLTGQQSRLAKTFEHQATRHRKKRPGIRRVVR